MSDSTSRLQDGELRVGDFLEGRYRIMDRIGWGGAGTVFEAIQEPLGRRVAVKVVRADLNEHARSEFSARFVKEASLAGQLSHPNIVTVHDYGVTAAGVQFVVMELLQGRSLKDAMAEGPVKPHLACQWTEALAAGLRHAHGRQLIHRDVKPSNVFLVGQEDGSERPLLMDFGLVKHIGEVSETRTGSYLGTPLYMAPEQSKGAKAIDGRVDIYALGCVLFHLLTGKPPYDAENALGLALQHLQDPLPPLVTYLGEALDGDLERIVHKAMAKHPDDRYRDAAAFASDLENWRRTHVHSPPRPRRRRGRGWLAALGGVAVGGILGVSLLIAAGAGLGWWYWSQKNREEPSLMADAGLGERAPIAGTEAAEPAEVPPVNPQPVNPQPVNPQPVNPQPVNPQPVKVASGGGPGGQPVKLLQGEDPPVTAHPVKPVTVAAPATGDGITVEGVFFETSHAERALRFANAANAGQLSGAGVYRGGISDIMNGRPYRSLEELAAMQGVGAKTIEAIAEATRNP